MAVQSEEIANSWGPFGGVATNTVGAFYVDPTGNKVGTVDCDVTGIDAATNATVHARASAGWKMIGGVLTVYGISLALNVSPALSLTGLVVALVASGNEIQARLTTLLGQNVTGGARFVVFTAS